jgi:hypothetical protein
MGKLIEHTDDKGRAKLREMFVALGGDAEVWDARIKQIDRELGDVGDIDSEMRRRPHYGKRKPG